jgi:hypothetical protein
MFISSPTPMYKQERKALIGKPTVWWLNNDIHTFMNMVERKALSTMYDTKI